MSLRAEAADALTSSACERRRATALRAQARQLRDKARDLRIEARASRRTRTPTTRHPDLAEDALLHEWGLNDPMAATLERLTPEGRAADYEAPASLRP